MAYAERRERQKGVRYRGIYKAADGSYRSAGTFSTEGRALEVAREADRHALVVGGAAGGLDPGIRATRTIKEYAPLFLRHHRVEENTKERYAAAKCRCEGCRQWARDYERERTRVQRAAASGRPGAAGRSLVIPTSPTWTSSSGIGSGRGRWRTAGFRSSRPPTRSGTRTPHGFDAGADLRDVQSAARHADPRTTMRYDRDRQNLDRHPNYILAAYMASGT